jgi:hypothetical protein
MEVKKELSELEKWEIVHYINGTNIDAPAYEQGIKDAKRGIYGFNPFVTGSNRARSYDLGNR